MGGVEKEKCHRQQKKHEQKGRQMELQTHSWFVCISVDRPGRAWPHSQVQRGSLY